MDQATIDRVEIAAVICQRHQFYSTAYHGDRDIRWSGAFEACKKVMDNYQYREIERREKSFADFIAQLAKDLPDVHHDEALGASLSSMVPDWAR